MPFPIPTFTSQWFIFLAQDYPPAIRSEADLSAAAHHKPGEATGDLLLPGRPAALCSHRHGQASTRRALAAAEAQRASAGLSAGGSSRPCPGKAAHASAQPGSPGRPAPGAGRFSLSRQRSCNIRELGEQRPSSSPGPGCAPRRRHFALLPNTAITLEHVQVVCLWKWQTGSASTSLTHRRCDPLSLAPPPAVLRPKPGSGIHQLLAWGQ